MRSRLVIYVSNLKRCISYYYLHNIALSYLVLQKATYELQNFSHWFVILTPSLSHILQFSEAELREESVTQRATRQTCDVSRGSIKATLML